MATLLLRETGRLRTFLPKQSKAKNVTRLPDDWSGFAAPDRVTSWCGRSMYIGLVSFIPLYFVERRPRIALDGEPGARRRFLLAGIAGTLVGGSLADTYGRRRVINVSMVASIAFVFLFAATTNAPGIGSIDRGLRLRDRRSA